jgi:outer membrane autotransporter protein
MPPPPALPRSPISVWAAAYGGAGHINGDPLVAGSSDLSARSFGTAVGLDYRIDPDTKIGFAMAGAGADWSLSGGLGTGNSNAIELGIHGTRQLGPAYVSAGVAGATYWLTTNRSVNTPVLPADQLKASFASQGLGGRLEAGYRVPVTMAPVGVIPYAAVQVQSFWTPSYSEGGQLPGPDPFALTFAAHQSTLTRTELGSRFDRLAPTMNGSLGLFGRLAWAHDTQSNAALTPTFLSLQTPSFVVNGAPLTHDKALTTAGAEWQLRNGWSFLGKFEGEFANRSATYTGTARAKYTW